MVRIGWSAAAAFAVMGVAAAPADPVPFKALDIGNQSGIHSHRDVVVRTAAEWTTLWKQHAGGRPRPAIDFARATVLGVFLGSRPAAGYTVAVRAIEREGAELVVTYRERAPSPTDMVAQMLTEPYLLVTVERFDGRVRFVRAP